MTVIAYRVGIMAADSGSWDTSDVQHSWARKLARGPDGTLYGIAGNAGEGYALLAWVNGGCRGDMPMPRPIADHDCSFIALRVAPGGSPELITAYGVEPYEGAPYQAIGAAREAALGALHAGASAEEAVAAAIEHSAHARGPVRSIRHEG